MRCYHLRAYSSLFMALVLIRPSIGEPLAFRSQQSRFGARIVIRAKRDSVVVAELELRHVTMQVLLVAMLINALHPALEQAKETLNRVGMDSGIFKGDVLAFSVIDRAVASHLLA